MIGSYKDITHETHTIIFTNSRKRASGFTPGVFQGMYFEVFISFVHCFGIIIKEKCSPFNQCIIQQPIMYINKVITPMTELSEPPSYMLQLSPREAGCFDLGGCSISEVNKPCNGETGSVFFHFYF